MKRLRCIIHEPKPGVLRRIFFFFFFFALRDCRTAGAQILQPFNILVLFSFSTESGTVGAIVLLVLLS